MDNPDTEFSKFDCIVVGGGSAGCGAAYGASMGGARVLLIETHGFLGGMGTAAGLSSFINFHYRKRDLSGSFYRLIRQDMLAMSATYCVEGGNADVFEPEALKLVLENRLINAGVSIAYHSSVLSVRREGGGWRVRLFHKSGARELYCRYLIDTTGDADVAVLAGVQTTHGRCSDGKTQPMSMVVQVGGVDPERFGAEVRPLIDGRYIFNSDCHAEQIALAKAQGKFSIPRENIAMMWSMPWDPSRVTLNGTRILGRSSCNIEDLSRSETEGRQQAWELVGFLSARIPGFEKAYLLATGPHIGVRESRRIVGRQNLTTEAVVESRIPEDTVVLCSYPIDVHHPDGTGTDFEFPREEICYGIPLDCLIPLEAENLIVAGRCISATHEAAGSFRVMPTCMTIGEAAGVAADLAWQENTRIDEVAPARVRRVLEERLDDVSPRMAKQV